MNRTAILYIAERCNQQCVFCLEQDGSWNEFVDPTTQQVFDVLERLRGQGGQHITFMGGETFFRKDLPRIVSQAKELGFTRVGVTTNGTVLAKAGFIASLRKAGLDFVELSIHGHTEALANAISRSNITYERQARAMRELEQEGLHTIVNVVVCRENHQHLVDVARYVLDTYPALRVRFKLKFVSLQGWALSGADAGTERPLGYDEVDFVAAGDFLARRNADFWVYNVPLCRLGAHARRAHELSTISVDENYFDMDHRSSDDYYDSGNQLEGRVWPTASCGPCTLRPVCPGLEEQHRLACGAGALATRSDDPEPLVRFALADRGADPDEAPARLAALARAPRPPVFVRNRPDGAIRFVHPDEALPFDLLLEPMREGKNAFHVAGPFALSYRLRSDDERQPSRQMMTLLLAARAAVDAAASAGVTLEEASDRVRRAAPAPWVAQARLAVSAEPRRKKWQLPVLEVASRAT